MGNLFMNLLLTYVTYGNLPNADFTGSQNGGFQAVSFVFNSIFHFSIEEEEKDKVEKMSKVWVLGPRRQFHKEKSKLLNIDLQCKTSNY